MRRSSVRSAADSNWGGGLTIWLSLAAALVLLVIWPLTELGVVATEEIQNSGLGAITSSTTVRASLNSMQVAIAVAVTSVVLGTASAFVTERSGRRHRRWLRLAILSSLFVPPFVSALSWLRAYGPSGLTDDAFGISFSGLLGPAGIVAVIAANAMPITYLIVAAALNSSVNRERERAARVSGAHPLRALLDVTLPLLAPALLGSGLLSFVIALNSFGVPAVLGSPARFATVTTLIYQDLARSAQPAAFTRAVLLACGLAMVAVLLSGTAELVLGGRGGEPRRAEASGPIASGARDGKVIAIGAWILVGLIAVMPLVSLVLVALTRGVGLDPLPANWTLSHFREAAGGRFLEAFGRSLLLATLAASLVTALGLVAALLPRVTKLVSALVLLAFAVPGSTLAVAVLLAYGPPLRDTLALILIAYLAKLWAIGHRSVLGSVRGLPPDLLWAARVAGASRFESLRTVLVPLLRPALWAGFVIVFLFAFHELTMSSLLYGPGTDTLAVAILNLQQIGDVPVSSALAVLMTFPLLALAIPYLVIGRLSRSTVGSG